MKHYIHLQHRIESFFAARGITVTIEPRGSRGPDLLGSGRERIAGEIKHAVEIGRDVPTKFWSDWNSPARAFGGKSKGETLIAVLPDAAETLPGPVRGWIAVIYGQLRYQARSESLGHAWLVVEGSQYREALGEALRFLADHALIRYHGPIDENGIGYVDVTFPNMLDSPNADGHNETDHQSPVPR